MLNSLSWLLIYGVHWQYFNNRRGSTQAEKEKEKRDELTQRYWLLSELFNTQDAMICYYHYYLNSKTKQTILIFAHWTVTIPPSLTVMWLGTSTRAPMPSPDDFSSPSPDDRSLQLEEEDGSDSPRVGKTMNGKFCSFSRVFLTLWYQCPSPLSTSICKPWSSISSQINKHVSAAVAVFISWYLLL